MRITRLAGALVILAFAQGASAATIWSEGVNGDLSGDRLAPTALTVAVDTNTITGSTKAGDVDYFTFTIPTGATLNQIVLTGFGVANLAFIAIQNGSVITETTSAPNPANLLGYTHIGPALVGTDILDDMGLSNLSVPAAQGFTPPLGTGDYSFWVQQFNAPATSYSFDVVVVPEPSGAALTALGLAGLALARRRRA